MGLERDEFFELGQPLDAVVMDGKSPLLSHGNTHHLLSVIVYNSDSADISGTLVNGKWIVKNQRHIFGKKILSDFTKVIKNLSF
jgi:formimidoylglutamate deiminase